MITNNGNLVVVEFAKTLDSGAIEVNSEKNHIISFREIKDKGIPVGSIDFSNNQVYKDNQIDLKFHTPESIAVVIGHLAHQMLNMVRQQSCRLSFGEELIITINPK